MPELPEVEIFRQYFTETSLNQSILEVEINHPKVVRGHEEILKKLAGDQFTGAKRWGKTMFIETGHNHILFMHFGMTGNLNYYHSTVESPKYARVIFSFESGFKLAYVSKRMFGRLGVTKSIADYAKEKSLGKDALEITESEFTDALAGKNKNIKAALLDQQVTAGVGNWIADEILYQSGIYPTTRTRDLNRQQLITTYKKMQEVVKSAIAIDAVREELPAHYITRYGRKTSISCPGCSNTIERTEVGGRGTYACGKCQQIY
ncbi:MAG: formamidopyrimidine-DNA glycosylase [Cyclobacteriaceae bacterium]|nr:MAG: formamidopyrimidine-DNA glycosylase [Cyclobacteriaceae bacterium]